MRPLDVQLPRAAGSAATEAPELHKSEAASAPERALAVKDTYAPSEVPGQNVALLRSRLAELQLRLPEAQANMQRALQETPLLVTDPKHEALTAAWLRQAAAGALDPEAMRQELASILRQGGARALAHLSQVVDARFVEACSERPQARAKLAAAMDCFSAEALSLLAQAQAAPNHRQAFLALLQANEIFGAGLGQETFYQQGTHHYFTNETGLSTALKQAQPVGGAAVGVSGAVLDVACAHLSELIISVDADPAIRHALTLIAGVLLIVDEQARTHGFDDAQRAKEVQARLTTEHPTVLDELQGLGLPFALRPEAEEILGQIRSASSEEGAAWLKGIPNDETSAAKSIRHLTNLALEGRIIAVSSGLGDPRITLRINAVTASYGTEVGSVCLTNVLDWVPDIKGLCHELGRLRLKSNAVTTSSQLLLASQSSPDFDKIEALGSFQKTSVLPARTLLGDTQLAANAHEVLWGSPNNVSRLMESWFYTVGHVYLRGVLKGVPLPKGPEEIPAYKEEILARLYGSRAAIAESIRSSQDYVLRKMEELAGPRAVLDALQESIASSPRPRSAADLETIVTTCQRLFWTPERKEAYLGRVLQEAGLEANRWPPLGRYVARAHSFRDLEKAQHALLTDLWNRDASGRSAVTQVALNMFRPEVAAAKREAIVAAIASANNWEDVNTAAWNAVRD